MKKSAPALLGPLFLFLAFFVGDTAAPGAALAEALVIKFATLAPEGSAWVKAMREVDKEIREKGQGRLGFQIYAGGIAGDELDVLKKMRIGQIHCAAFSGVGFGQILPMVRVMDLPFLFRNPAEGDMVKEALRPYFGEAFAKKGFELLSWAEVGDVHLLSKVPLHKVGDLGQRKVWAWSGDPIARETFGAMGVSPIPLAVTDVTTALSTGMVDTVYAPPLGALAMQWHTRTRAFMELPLAHSTGAILMASGTYQKIPGDLRVLLGETLAAAMGNLTVLLRKQSVDAVEIMRKGGLVIVPPPTGGDLEAFYRVHGEVATRLLNTLYPETLLKRVYEILKRPTS